MAGDRVDRADRMGLEMVSVAQTAPDLVDSAPLPKIRNEDVRDWIAPDAAEGKHALARKARMTAHPEVEADAAEEAGQAGLQQSSDPFHCRTSLRPDL